jgi:hypothetical protein
MFSIGPLPEMAFVLCATVAPIVIAVRLLAGRIVDFEGLVQYAPLAWPQGVQEEEPQPWKFGAATA